MKVRARNVNTGFRQEILFTKRWEVSDVVLDQNEAKTLAHLQRHKLKSKQCGFYVNTIDSKLARTFTDDADMYHGLRTRRHPEHRPGQRDDESRCAFGTILPV